MTNITNLLPQRAALRVKTAAIAKLIALTLSFCLNGFVGAQEAHDWSPFSVLWQCLPSAGGSSCSLYVVGDLPSGVNNPDVYAFIRIHRGPVLGRGLILAAPIAKLNCTVAVTLLYCSVLDAVTVGPGVTVNTGATTDINVYLANGPGGPAFDWDGDGMVSRAGEGLMLLRYALGFSAEAVVQGVTLSPGRTAASVYAAIAGDVAKGWFNFSGASQGVTLRDAQVAARCLQGLRGAALVLGTGLTASSVIDGRCDDLVALQ